MVVHKAHKHEVLIAVLKVGNACEKVDLATLVRLIDWNPVHCPQNTGMTASVAWQPVSIQSTP